MHQPHRSLFLLIPVLGVLGTSSPARADRSDLSPETGYHYGEQEDGRWGAMGGALRAMGNGTTAVFSNPANMATSRVYHLSALAGIGPEAKRQSYGAAAVDSVTTRLAAGVGFAWNDQDPSGLKRRSSDLRVALAFPFSDMVAFGVTGRYLKLTQQGLGPLGRSYASGGMQGDAIVNGFSFDAGLNLRPSKNVSIGALGSNLSNPGNGFQPTSFGGGIGVGNEDMVFEVDALADFTTWQHTTGRAMSGFEFLAADHFPLRAGYQYDGGAGSHAVSGGVGYVDPQFSIEFSARRSVVGEGATTLFFTLQYFVESAGITRASSGDN